MLLIAETHFPSYIVLVHVKPIELENQRWALNIYFNDCCTIIKEIRGSSSKCTSWGPKNQNLGINNF